MQKEKFLRLYGFPSEWLAFGLYDDELFAGQIKECANDVEPHPDEHLRYGAFLWWLRRHQDLATERLKQLALLAVLDPDPPMASAAVYDILFHPSANKEVADYLAEKAPLQPGWDEAREIGYTVYFHRLLDEGRRRWNEKRLIQEVVQDVQNCQLKEERLRHLYELKNPLILRALVEHPNLPVDLLVELSSIETIKYAKEIRGIAKERMLGKFRSFSHFIDSHSADPWTWGRRT